MSANSNLPANLNTDQLYSRIQVNHQTIMERLQFLFENREMMTSEEIERELECIGELKVSEWSDVNVLKFRTDLQEKTIEVINMRQADMLQRIDDLEDIITTDKAVANKRANDRSRQREKNAYKTGHWAAVTGRH